MLNLGDYLILDHIVNKGENDKKNIDGLSILVGLYLTGCALVGVGIFIVLPVAMAVLGEDSDVAGMIFGAYAICASILMIAIVTYVLDRS